MRILLWKIGALGDIVMTTPLVRQLRRAQPAATIDYLTGRGCTAVLAGIPGIDHVAGFDERVLYRPQVRRLPEVVALLRGYDLVFTLDKHWVFPLLAWWARIPRRVGFARTPGSRHWLTQSVPYGALRHEIDYYLDLLPAAGWEADGKDVRLDAAASGLVPAGSPAGATVLINSGGANAYETSQVRRMPDDLFGALVAACRARGPVAFLGTAAESPYYERFAGEGVHNLCGRTSLAEACAVLRGARQVVTTDTGLMHLAGALNTAVTAVFGPTHPLRKCPPGVHWAWADADRYDDAYEVFGRLPAGRWFERLTVADILEQAQPSPFDARLATTTLAHGGTP